MMANSGIVPWKRQLELCSRWLEIIQQELPLKAQYVTAEEANELCADAATLLARARGLCEDLERIAIAAKAVP